MMENTDDVMREMEELEAQIGELPIGYISKKNIHGKIRYYRQWTESGKIKSQYIKEEDLEEIQGQIERRRELQQRLKELNQSLKGTRKPLSGDRQRGGAAGFLARFETNVLVGEELLAMAGNIQGHEKRDCYTQLSSYLHGEGARGCVSWRA